MEVRNLIHDNKISRLALIVNKLSIHNVDYLAILFGLGGKLLIMEQVTLDVVF